MKYKIAGALILLAALLAELWVARTRHWNFDGFGFFAWYGFLSSVVLILISKLLGKWLKRGETYYRD